MAGRGPQSFKKRQKEQQRKERQQEKAAKRLERKQARLTGQHEVEESDQLEPETSAEETEQEQVSNPLAG